MKNKKTIWRLVLWRQIPQMCRDRERFFFFYFFSAIQPAMELFFSSFFSVALFDRPHNCSTWVRAPRSRSGSDRPTGNHIVHCVHILGADRCRGNSCIGNACNYSAVAQFSIVVHASHIACGKAMLHIVLQLYYMSFVLFCLSNPCDENLHRQ